MNANAIIDLHCDTLTASSDSAGIWSTLDRPGANLSLSNLPRNVNWCQCFAIFIPDGLTKAEAVSYYERYQKSFDHQMEHFMPRAAACRTAAQIEQAWGQGKTAAILTVENGCALAGDLSRVEVLARDGVKIMTLTWNGENEIGSGNTTEHGLSDFGRKVIPAMEQAGILADVSHLNDPGFRDVLETAEKPFLATHSNARAVCGHKRNLTDDQIREMVARHCLIGLNYYSLFLREDGAQATLEDLFRHIAHFLELGAENCLALGSDFDGADVPPCLDSPEKIAGLYDYLAERGLHSALIEQIMYGNAMNFFKSNLVSFTKTNEL